MDARRPLLGIGIEAVGFRQILGVETVAAPDGPPAAGGQSADELPQHHRCEGGGVGHAAAEAGVAEPAPLAGEGDDPIAAAASQ